MTKRRKNPLLLINLCYISSFFNGYTVSDCSYYDLLKYMSYMNSGNEVYRVSCL